MNEAAARFDVPLYSVADAARHIKVPRATFDTWARGYERRVDGRPPTRGRPIVTALDAPRGHPRIPFIGLAEAYVLAGIRRAGVPLQRIRPAVDELEAKLGIAHVLASRALYTDGAEVLYDYAEAHGDTPEARAARELVVVRNQQRVFRDVIDDYLRRIDFSGDGWAGALHLPQYRGADVVIDPARSFGLPIFARGAAQVEVVLGRFKAGESATSIENEFGVPPDQLIDAVRVHLDTAA